MIQVLKEPDVSDYNGDDMFVANSTANETGVGVDLCSLYWSEGMYDNHQGWPLLQQTCQKLNLLN